ncbi:MAG: GlcG/HbpS family heme-binding protein [bacterium]|jgi:glc operon protein GlcG|nr:heme-binding protein [Betaproteobacteria bacterium]
MADVVPHLKLTHEGAMKMLAAGMAKAKAMGQDQCITIVDDGGHLLAFVRMDGGRVLSTHTSRKKAMTAASNRKPTGSLDPANEVKLAIASDGMMTNLMGGLPIIVDGHVIGAVGVGSGTGEQDLEVAKAAIAALPGAQAF